MKTVRVDLDESRSDKPLETARKRILVVDDSAPLRKMLALMLENQGYEVVQAGGAKEALNSIKAVKNAPFDLIVTDLNMPEVSGFELIEWLQRLGDLRAPVVVCSSNCDTRTIGLMKKAGIKHYIRKPFYSETVRMKIAGALAAGEAAKARAALEAGQEGAQ